jgi:hypothetical protein
MVIGCSSGWGGSLSEIEKVNFKEAAAAGGVYIAGLMDAPEDTQH